MSQNFSFGIKSLYSSGIKGHVVQRDILNDWRKQYFVLNSPFLNLYSDETCRVLCNSFNIEKKTVVHNRVDYDNHSNLIKLDLFSVDNDSVIYLSVDDDKQANDLHEAISEIIHDGFRLISLTYLWPAEFYPIVLIQCKFMDNPVDDGAVIRSSSVTNRPSVTVMSSTSNKSTRQHYSLLLLNADYSEANKSSNDGTEHLYLDWAVVNIIDGNVSTGFEVATYEAPKPKTTLPFSRHFFLLFGHEQELTSVQSSTLRDLAARREAFSVRAWASCLQATSPAAIEGFRMQQEMTDLREPQTIFDNPQQTATSGFMATPTKGSPTASSKPSPVQPPSALKKNAQARTAASPAKKLVSFMIVHPTLMSDSLAVSPSFYEGLEHEQALGIDETALVGDFTDEGGPDDDLPDYQVEYASVGVGGGHSISSHNMVSRHASGGDGIPVSPSMSSNDALSISMVESLRNSPQLSPTSSNTNSNSSNPVGRQVVRQNSEISMTGGSGSNRSLVPLMQRVGQAQNAQDYCAVFGVTTLAIFEGEMMRKKFTRDYVMKESFVWIEPASKSIHWARSATQKNVKHKHILLDKNSSYNLIGADGESVKTPPGSNSTGATPFVYKKAAGGALSGVIKGAELEDLTITITTENDQRLKIKIPPQGSFATLRAKEWFKVIKLLTQDTANK